MKKRISAILLTIVMLLSMLPMSAFAADAAPSYVALGDSISTGYGLADKTAEGFTYLLADELGYELTNLAADGNTAAGILAQLQEQSYKNAVAGADLITVTAGGNDLMALLYQAIATEYNKLAVAANAPITPDEVLTIMSDPSDGRRLTVMSVALGLLTEGSDIYLLDDEAFADAVTAYVSTLNLVLSTIKTLNADATVVVATQYNPYVEFDGAAIDAIWSKIDLTPICDGMEEGVTALNTAIKSNAATGGYLVADVKAAFDEQNADLYVADPVALNLDFHPNATGHSVLADVFAAAAVPPVPVAVSAASSSDSRGSVSGDGEFTKSDQVTLTATPAHENTRFCYWLDNSVELPEAPTEAQLKEAIVSYDSTYTFTAEEDVSLTAVFGYQSYLHLTRMAYETKDEYFADEEAGLGIRLDEEEIRYEIGNAPVTVDKTAFADTETVDGAIYNLDCIIWANYNETEEEMEYQILERFAVPVAPVYNSVEYWQWLEQYEQYLTVAYLRHNHAYETKFDANGHWTECACEDKTAAQPHSFSDDADTTCDCGYTRTVELHFFITYTDGVENEQLFTDQTYRADEGSRTPAFVGTPEREGYVFIGWSPEVTQSVTENVTYVALWEEELVITVNPMEFSHGKSVTLTSNLPLSKVKHEYLGARHDHNVHMDIVKNNEEGTSFLLVCSYDHNLLYEINEHCIVAERRVTDEITQVASIVIHEKCFYVTPFSESGKFLNIEGEEVYITNISDPLFLTLSTPISDGVSTYFEETDEYKWTQIDENTFRIDFDKLAMNALNKTYSFDFIRKPDTVECKVLVYDPASNFISTLVGNDVAQEVSVIVDGKLLDATVKVDFRDENKIPASDAKKIRDYANSKFSDKTYAFEWMDISLIGEDANPIRELDSPLAFGFDMAGRNVLGVASVHNGTLVRFGQLNDWDWSTPNIPIWASSGEIIGETDPEKIAEHLIAMGRLSPETGVLFAGCFSTYAIIYEVEPTPDTPSSPQTGDNSHMALWLALLFISGGAIITLTVYDSKRRKNNI